MKITHNERCDVWFITEHRFRSHDEAFCANCGGDWRGSAYPYSWPDRHGKRYAQSCEKCRSETVYEISSLVSY